MFYFTNIQLHPPRGSGCVGLDAERHLDRSPQLVLKKPRLWLDNLVQTSFPQTEDTEQPDMPHHIEWERP
jgi:hypothetical protein